MLCTFIPQHTFRIKILLLRNGVLGHVIALLEHARLGPRRASDDSGSSSPAPVRAVPTYLLLAALRCFRAVVALRDDMIVTYVINKRYSGVGLLCACVWWVV